MRLPVIVAGVAAAWLALAAPAYAHITVSSPDATQGGGSAILTFQVPDESDTAARPVAAANPAATTHSGSSQTGSVVLASIALAVALVALGLTVVRWRRT